MGKLNSLLASGLLTSILRPGGRAHTEVKRALRSACSPVLYCLERVQKPGINSRQRERWAFEQFNLQENKSPTFLSTLWRLSLQNSRPGEGETSEATYLSHSGKQEMGQLHQGP